MRQDDLQALFADALTFAAMARDKFTEMPLVPSKRGGPRLSPWWRIWRDSAATAARLARLLPVGAAETTLQDELDALLQVGGLRI